MGPVTWERTWDWGTPLWTEYYGMLENIMGWDTAPPQCEQTETENITFPILRMRAVIRKSPNMVTKLSDLVLEKKLTRPNE